MIKKLLKVVSIVIAVGIFGYVTFYVYKIVEREIIESRIREAGLNPDDYDLRGIAPWNVREFVTEKEVEKIENEGFPAR